VLIWVTWMSLLALRVTVPPSPCVDVASMDPVCTFPVSLVTVMLPPSVFLVLELELRSRVLMSPLAFRSIAPP
jgi:hypothetical protein